MVGILGVSRLDFFFSLASLGSMEEVEEANRAAVESCHRVLNLLSQPQDQNQFRNIMVETGEAVCKFKKVASLLNSNGLGHARARKVKNSQIPLSKNILLDNPSSSNDHPSNNLHFLQSGFMENHPIQEVGLSFKSSLCLGNSSVEMSSNGKTPIQFPQPTTASQYHFLQQQQQLQQKFQLQQQQMKHQAEMMLRKSNSGINLNFDSSSCTPTMSSNRSFISSLSIDGSVANMDGNSFHLIGATRSLDQNSLQHKRRCSVRGEEGSIKCGSSSRCHCKKRLVPLLLLYKFAA